MSDIEEDARQIHDYLRRTLFGRLSVFDPPGAAAEKPLTITVYGEAFGALVDEFRRRVDE